MTIKGKGKTRSKRVARAPRRGVVEVPKPWLSRRWAQVTMAFAVGVLASIFMIWLTNGLRENSERDQADDLAASARAAVQAWSDQLTRRLADVGTVTPGIPPVVLPQAATSIDALAAGEDVDAATLEDARATLGTAIKGIDAYALVATIRDQGLDVTETNYVLNSRDKVLEALRVYREAIDLAIRAAGADGAEREDLAGIAADLRDRAVSLFADGYQDLTQAQASVGIAQPPLVPGPSGALGLP